MSEPAPSRSPRLLDRHFRWRSSEVSRLEALTDSVFGIVLGLLFLRAAPPENFTDLAATMKGLIPFAATFAILGYIWLEHWIFARRYDLHDAWTTFLNIGLLFLLLAYAYPLKFLFTLMTVAIFGPIGTLTEAQMRVGHDADAHVRIFVFYGVGYAGVFLSLALMYVRAFRLRELLRLDALEVHLTRAGIAQCLVQAGVGVASIAIVLLESRPSGAPGWIYCAIGPLMGIHGAWEGRTTRRLLAAR